MNEVQRLERKITFYKVIAWLFVVMGFVAGGLGLFALPKDTPFSLEHLASLGSFYQGTVASFWSLGALFFVYVAFLGQKQALSLQHEELAEQKRQFETQRKDQEEQRAREQRKRIDALLAAIYYELQILGKIYKLQAGGLLENLEPAKPYMTYFSLTEKYFIVYPNNTELAGHIEDEELSKAIAVTYNLGKFLIEMFRINNWYLNRHAEMTKWGIENPGGDLANRVLKGTIQRLTEWAGELKKAHAGLEVETKSLLEKIERYRKAHPVDP